MQTILFYLREIICNRQILAVYILMKTKKHNKTNQKREIYYGKHEKRVYSQPGR